MSVFEHAEHDLYGVKGLDAGAVEYLLAAGSAGGGNHHGDGLSFGLVGCIADGWEKNHLAYFH